MKRHLPALALMGLALTLSILLPPLDPDRALAMQLLGEDVTRVELPGAPAFQAGDRGLVFFERRGQQGPIRGALLLDRGRVERLLVLSHREGIDLAALDDPGWQRRFVDRRTDVKLVAEPVSGASISSQAVVEIVNERLVEWRRHVR